MLDLPHGWLAVNSPLLYPQIEVEPHFVFKHVAYNQLPSLGEVDGTFTWLPALATGREPIPMVVDCEEDPALVARKAERLVGEAAQLGLALPASFSRFMSSDRCARRLASWFGGYFELGDPLHPPDLEAIPGREGPQRLLRFFCDPQTYLWALLLEPGGTHRVVYASPDPRRDWALSGVTVCAPSFEAFIKRFWIESSLVFTLNAMPPEPVLDDELRAYLDATARVTPPRR
jgi:hypothetical protein